MRRTVLSLCVLLSVACSQRATYPIGTTLQFDIVCVRNLWPGAPAAPLDVREAFCRCLVQRCERRYDAEGFDRIRLALARGDYRLDAAGVPPEFRQLVAECQSEVDRGQVKVQ